MMRLSSNTRKLREENQLSRLKVHKETGIEYPTLIALERGGDAALLNVCKLALYFEIPMHRLVDPASGSGEKLTREMRAALINWLVQQKPARGHVTGLAYHRRKNRMSKRTLAKVCGVTTGTLINMERDGLSLMTSVVECIRIAGALGVTIDELLMQYPGAALEAGDRGAYGAQSKNPDNPVDNYRVQHNLTYRELGRRLSLSHQAANNGCRRKVALKAHIERLSEYEKISSAEFMTRYGAERKGMPVE